MTDEIVGELYRIDPDRFTAERDRHVADAREAGDSQTADRLRKLRKPVIAAWALNNLRHIDPDRVDQLFELGEQVRAAQRELRGDELRGLGRQRDEMVDALTGRAAALAADAGHPLSASTTEQMRQTLIAALSDPEAAQRLSEATLTKPAEYSGFGINEVADWVAADPPAKQAPERRGSEKQAGEDKAAEPERSPRQDAERRRWETEYAEGKERRDVAAEQLDRARAELDAAEREQRAVEQRRTRLREELAKVDQEAREVEKALKVAGNRLREARRGRELADGRIAELTRRMPPEE
jgi:hypothetical protein